MKDAALLKFNVLLQGGCLGVGPQKGASAQWASLFTLLRSSAARHPKVIQRIGLLTLKVRLFHTLDSHYGLSTTSFFDRDGRGI